MVDSNSPLIDPVEAAKLAAESRELAELCVQIADDRKAGEVKLFDVSKSSMIADYYMICSGNSEPHLRAIAGHIEKEVKEQFNLYPKGETKAVASKWLVMDYPNVLIHILHPQARDYYRLEELWKEGKQIFPAQDGE